MYHYLLQKYFFLKSSNAFDRSERRKPSWVIIRKCQAKQTNTTTYQRVHILFFGLGETRLQGRPQRSTFHSANHPNSDRKRREDKKVERRIWKTWTTDILTTCTLCMCVLLLRSSASKSVRVGNDLPMNNCKNEKKFQYDDKRECKGGIGGGIRTQTIPVELLSFSCTVNELELTTRME